MQSLLDLLIPIPITGSKWRHKLGGTEVYIFDRMGKTSHPYHRDHDMILRVTKFNSEFGFSLNKFYKYFVPLD